MNQRQRLAVVGALVVVSGLLALPPWRCTESRAGARDDVTYARGWVWAPPRECDETRIAVDRLAVACGLAVSLGLALTLALGRRA